MKMRSKKVILCITTVLLILSCGQNKAVEKTKTDLGSVISIDHTVVARLKTLPVEFLKPLAPSAVAVDVKLIKGAEGYILHLTWECEGPNPFYWDVEKYSDLDNGTDGDSNFNETIQVFGQKFSSLHLTSGRRYKFLLIAQLKGATVGNLPDGGFVYKTIRVNLKGMP